MSNKVTPDTIDPKLLHARAVIEELLNRLDLAGHVVLLSSHGRAEAMMKLPATWNYIIAAPGQIGVRCKGAESPDPPEEQATKLASTGAMLATLGEILGRHALGFIELGQEVDLAAGLTHSLLHKVDSH